MTLRKTVLGRNTKEFFFRKKLGGEEFFRQIFLKTRPRYPVNLDRSLPYHASTLVKSITIFPCIVVHAPEYETGAMVHAPKVSP